jgi:uncharacterized membrane protein YvlD (DUF360 family)
MYQLRALIRLIVRFLVVWVVDGVSLLFTAWLLPGVSFTGATGTGELLIAGFSAAFVLALVNILIRPLILMIARPLGFIAVFIIGFLVNAIALGITAWLLPYFEAGGLITLIIAGLIFAAINTILTAILDVNEEGSLNQNRIERAAAKDPMCAPGETGRGLVMVEIDGLSYHHIRHALDTGKMPFLKWLLDQRGYALSKIDCGIPSQTSACQAGIMFGDNDDIPAYRWYDKDQGKLYVSASDAAELNTRYSNGTGLMRQGSSISNMMAGDAEKSLFTLANLKTPGEGEAPRRAQDIYLLMLNPYFLMRTIVLFLGEAGREIWQGRRQVRNDVQPRLNRMHGFFPFVRAGTTTFMRELGTNLVILDVVRGAPSIYFTWPGYDEVAHHAGPWTEDAIAVLKPMDAALGRIYRAAQERAPRPYDFVVLSDHGQSFGPTFLQRYGISLKEFIEQHLPSGMIVSQVVGGDTGLGPLTAVGAELGNLQGAGTGGAAGKAVAKQGQRLIDKGTEQRRIDEGEGAYLVDGAKPQVVAYGSGNLAQVYFDLLPRKILLSELNAAYPGMVDALVGHEGIGMVCGYADDGTPVCLGKGGTRNLHTGEVTGTDPLPMYAPADPKAYGHASLEKRIWQVRRVMDFPHAGDLMVISTVYPDGTVAALEELIGSHGGVGGEQTDAMLFHPGSLVVGDTRNSTDVFGLLDARRGLPMTEAELNVLEPATVEVDPWSRDNLWGGIKDMGTWVPLALRCLALDRSAYRRVAEDPRMTGPGLLLGLGFSALAGLLQGGRSGHLLGSLVSLLVAFALTTFAVYAAGRILARNGEYPRTMRALGFARTTTVVLLLGLLPDFLGIATVSMLVLAFLAFWMAATEAHEVRGWRGVLLPILAIVVALVIPPLVMLLLGGAVSGIESILETLGLVAGG